MSDMTAQTHLFRRNATYYFRAKVPVDLRAAFGCAEVKHSLRTKELAVARQLAREASADFGRRCETLRRKRQHTAASQALTLTDANIKALCDQWRHTALGGDEQTRQNGDFSPEMADDRETSDARLRELLASGDVDHAEPALQFFLHLLGLEVVGDAEQQRRLRYRFLQTIAATHREQIQRDQGEIVWTPEPPSTLQTAASAASSMSKGTAASDTHSWDALYDDWLRFEPDRRPKTLEDMQRVLREFRALIPKKAPPEITRQNVMAYRDDLVVNKRRKAKTVDKKITFLSALFNVAINHGKLTVNPAARIPKPRDDSARREPFTRDDLQKLFDSVLYSEQQTLGIHTGAASQWLPLLSLFTGCREEELGQLLVDDVQQIDGVWCLLIEASEGKKLKTRNAQRRLPVHPKLIESGWLDYMHRLKKAGQKRLFPALKADRYGTLTAQFSKRFNRYLRSELGIDSPTKVFHSFRHTFRDACREAGLDEELADALMGHASNGKTGRHYGNSFSVQRLQQAIQRIDYPGLEIPKIDVANLPTSSIQSEAKAARTTRRKPSAAAHSGPRPDDRNAAAQPEKPRQSRSKQTKSAATRKAKTPDFAGWYARRRAAKAAR